jgi:hypothetical protein
MSRAGSMRASVLEGAEDVAFARRRAIELGAAGAHDLADHDEPAAGW